jgi:hypothetical protein
MILLQIRRKHRLQDVVLVSINLVVRRFSVKIGILKCVAMYHPRRISCNKSTSILGNA